MKYILLASLLISTNPANALDIRQIIDKVKTVQKNKPSEHEHNGYLVRQLMNDLKSLTFSDKRKIKIFRQEQQKALDEMLYKFDLLPESVRKILKRENDIRARLSPQEQQRLDADVNNIK